MQKFLYVIIPACLLVAFIGYYSVDSKALSQQEAAKKHQIELVQRDQARQRAEAEARAAADAKKREEDRIRDEQAKEAARELKFRTDLAGIKEAAAAAAKQADALSQQAAKLEIQLDGLRNKHATESQETFDLTKQTELMQIARQNADFETQRMTTMLTARVNQSWLAQPPPPPPAK